MNSRITNQDFGNETAAVPVVGAVIVGAGFAGLYAAYRLSKLGLTFQVIEAGADVGGTWYWNRYPGARCDVVSMEYSYSFSEDLEQEWVWSEKYATQPEILRYVNHVADRFDLRRHIRFNTRVASVALDEDQGRWMVKNEDGTSVDTKYVVSAAGCLSAAKAPEISGIENFRGDIHHTGNWPHEGVDFTGKRVAVIGTGSSGIQAIPVIAQQASQLTVFQRTANFSLPAQNRPLGGEEVAAYKREYRTYRQRALQSKTGIIVERGTQSAVEVDPEERTARFETCWDLGAFPCIGASYPDIITNLASNDTAADFVRTKIRSIVKDPDLAEDLTPRDYPFGTKRICMDTGYFDTFNRDNVELVNLKRDPIETVTADGIRTRAGEYEFDVIVFATGFDAITGPLLRMNITGRRGETLNDKWADGPQTYLGIQTAGFPNLFMITGPGSPSTISNMMVSIEQHVDWVARCIEALQDKGIGTIEADPDAEAAWTAHVNEVASETLYPKAASWFMGANVPGKPRVFMPYLGGIGVYREKCDAVAASGFEGFILDRSLSDALPEPA